MLLLKKNSKKIKPTSLFALLSFGVISFTSILFSTSPVYAATREQIVDAQILLPVCLAQPEELDRNWGVPENLVAKAREVCEPENVDELVEICAGDVNIQNVDQNKYYVAGDLLIDFCSKAGDLSPGNQSQSQQEVDRSYQFAEELRSQNSPIDNIVEEARRAAGCSVGGAVGQTDFCTSTNTEIVSTCRADDLDPALVNVCAGIRAAYQDDTDAFVEYAVRAALVEASAGLGVSNNANAEDGDPTCEDSGWFSWIQCPLLRAADSMISYLDNQIDSLLRTPEDYYKNDSVEQAWGRIRNLAYILLIPIFLVMIIGTALGFSFVDAYTVKRALPRLFLATIFIALSLPLLSLAMDINTVFGRGIAGIVLSAVPGANDITLAGLFDPSGIDATLIWGGIVITAAAFPIWIGAATLMAITVLLSLFTIFVLLAFRQMLLIGLMIVAPLAILSWIFPGNDKLWKLWGGSFWNLMFLYPLIMFFLAVGRIFAVIIRESPIDGIIAILLIIVAYVGPFFLVPTAFRYAGGALANIAGLVNNRNRGVFDRLRKARGQSLQKGWQDRRSGKSLLGGGQDTLRGKYASFLRGATNVNKAGLNPLTARSKMRTALSDSSDAMIKDYSNNEAFQPIAGDDAKLWAARFESRQDIANELATRDADRFAGSQNARARNDAVEQILRAQKAAPNRDTFQRARIRSQATTGTGYQNAAGEFDASLMIQDINSTYGNDRNGAAGAIAQMRNPLVQAGQVAGQAGFNTWAQAAEDMYRAQTSGASAAQRLAVAQRAHDSIMDGAIDSSNPGSAIYGKPSSARAFGAAHARRIQELSGVVSSTWADVQTATNGLAAGTHTQVDIDNARQAHRDAQESVDAATAAAAGILDAMGQASPQNASAFANELMGVTVSGSGQTMHGGAASVPLPAGTAGPVAPMTQAPDITIRDMIDDRMLNEEYRNRRRDIGASTAAQAQAYLQQQQNPINPGAAQPPAGGPQAGGGPPTPSDVRLKKNIRLIKIIHGINLYRFEYLWSDEVYVGVMAQEIVADYPEAVFKNPQGYYLVNYDKLPVDMTTYRKYIENEAKSVNN